MTVQFLFYFIILILFVLLWKAFKEVFKFLQSYNSWNVLQVANDMHDRSIMYIIYSILLKQKYNE